MILVIQTAFLGDLLLSVPLLKRIKSKYPQKKILLLCRNQYGSFFKNLDLCDDYFEVSVNKNEIKSFYEKFKDFNFDIIISPHKSFRTNFLVAKLRAKIKIGFKNFYNFLFLHQRIRFNHNWPDAIRQISLLKNLDSDLNIELVKIANQKSPFTKIPNWADMRISYNYNVSKTVINKFKIPEKPYVVISPGSVWPTKRWTTDGYSLVADNYIQKNYNIVIVGSPDEVDVCENLYEKIRSKSNVLNLAGKTTIAELASIIGNAKILITNDNGSMHMASLMGTPCVAIFGPTTLELGYQPWSIHALTCELDLKCRPCGKHGSKKCPLGTHDCMLKLDATKVIATAEELVNSSILQ